MTKDELRLQVFRHILDFIAGNYIENMFSSALKQTGNDPEKALQFLIDHLEDSPVQGGFGSPDGIAWQHFGGFRSVGEAWLPGHHYKHPADLTFTLKDILEWMAVGKPQAIQMEMF